MSEHISIDTNDLAYSLDNVTDRVEETVDAVSEMGRSVCDVERQAADKVCHSVNRGFFSLIRSQLAQRKVQVQAAAESQLLTLRHFAQSLRRIKHQMGVDFERITLRYTKLFKTLSESLQSRVYALDRPAAEVADTDYNVMNRRVMTSGAPAVVVQEDVVSAATELAVVRCKRDSRKVLDGVKALIDHGTKLNRTMDCIVRDVCQEVARSVFVPVVVCESTDLFLTDGVQINFIMSELCDTNTILSKIKKVCFESMDEFVWSSSRAVLRTEICRRIRESVEKATLSEREGKIVADLLEKSCWNVLETIR